MDFFDTSGTLLSMATFIGNFIPNFVGEDKSFPRSIWAYCSDGISISVGACFGTSPCTAFIESATGIKEGGRTGITALTVAFCMFVSMFFAPLIASIPVFATGPALILVGKPLTSASLALGPCPMLKCCSKHRYRALSA